MKNCGATAAAAPHPSEHPGSSEREEEIAGEPVAASQLLVASTGSAEQVRGAVSIALSAKQRHIGCWHITLGCVTQSIGPFLINMWLVRCNGFPCCNSVFQARARRGTKRETTCTLVAAAAQRPRLPLSLCVCRLPPCSAGLPPLWPAKTPTKVTQVEHKDRHPPPPASCPRLPSCPHFYNIYPKSRR